LHDNIIFTGILGIRKNLTAVKMLSGIEPLSILRKLGGSRPVNMRKLGGSSPVDMRKLGDSRPVDMRRLGGSRPVYSEIKDENIWRV
ncbi:MAG: hypothetical protein K2M39_06965, partial [Muribaculaceae bacterium]|nr:hypothetical protein [Muribaculaceae bacterium]